MSNRIPVGDLGRQTSSIRREIDDAIADVLDSGWYVLGRHVTEFEAEFAAAVGTRHAIGVASGAEALYLALAALGVGPGDEVITVANACTYQLAAIEQVGATAVFVDVDEHHVIDPEAVDAECTDRTRAIIAVHLYGRLAPMARLGQVARRRGIPVVEDAAQAHGAWQPDHDGRRRHAGAWGAVGCFSFYPSKNLGAIGDGGAVTTDDDELASLLRQLRMYGWASKYRLAHRHGRNSRLDELQAAILRVKLRHLDEWTEARRERAEWYRSLLEPALVRSPLDEPGHVYHLFVVECDRRDDLRRLLDDRGVATDVHYPIPTHLQAGVADRHRAGTLDRTERAAHTICSLPMFPELTRSEVERVAAAVDAVASELGITAEGAAT